MSEARTQSTKRFATQQRQFVKLDRLAYRRNDFAETIIGLRRAKGSEAAADAIPP